MNFGKLFFYVISLFLMTFNFACTETENTKATEQMTTANTIKQSDMSTIRNQYTLHVKLFNNVTNEVSDEEAKKRISENTNNFLWITGHTLDIQYNLANLLGIQTENPYAEQFAFGKTFDPNGDYPSLEKMKKDWNALAPKVSDALEQLTEEQLSADTPFPIPFPDQSIQGLLGFQMHHLAYEIGQLGLYRRFLNKRAMSYQ